MQTVNDIKFSTIPEGYSLCKNKIVISFRLFIPLLGGKHNCLHAKSSYKEGKVL